MNKLLLTLALALLAAVPPLCGQQDSDVLFTVAGAPVTVGEFRYIYTKTNGETADFSKESVQEYLDLYQRFKLKVARARAMGLDTVTALQQELEGYRQQLADNYLVDRRVTDRLVEALYARKQQDVDISHLLFRAPATAPAADTLAAYERALAIQRDLTAANFAATAREHSDDTYSKERGGRIGFITAPFPDGLHRLEEAVYGAPVNTVVGPVRTALGYHLALKHAVRPARGEVEIAHIMVRKPAGAKGALPPPEKIRNARALLEQGEDFARVAATYSEDEKTAKNAGYIGFFGINRYEPTFEEAAFALAADGAVSDIIETQVGWHLLRRVSRREAQTLRDQRPLLEQKVKTDGRFADAMADLRRELREQSGLTEDPAVFGRYAATLVDSSFFSYRWTPRAEVEDAPLLTFGSGRQLGLADFQQYLKRNARQRLSLSRQPRTNAATVAKALYDEWVEEQLMDYAEGQLEKQFPEFAALMREYREGILLFEATKVEVWDKASEDTLGLRRYFEEHRDDYAWDERATVTRYVIDHKKGLDAEEVYAFAADHGPDATLDKFGRANLDGTTEDYELDRLAELGELPTTPGGRTALTKDMRQGTSTFYKVEEILPPRPKELREARGYVIADYQDQLEREWVAALRKEFPVKVNKRVLAKLIKS